MPDSNSATARPFTAFNFRVRIELGQEPLCSAAFSECTGLEMTMEPNTHREGGKNATEYQMVGPVSYGNLTLRRGMTETFDLWGWFNRINRPQGPDGPTSGGYGTRARVVVEMLASEGAAVNARFTLEKCLPVKLSAPDLNASDGRVAIEEMQIAYERLEVEIPGASSDGGGGGSGGSISASVSAGGSASVSGSIG